VNRHPQHELFSPERPVFSEASRHVNYARRRIVTVLVLAVVLIGGGYAVWGGKDAPPDPDSIPTVKADEAYKQTPDDPGGIDIPHQDVRVYQQLEGKGTDVPKVEHLMPSSEEPKDLPPADAAATTASAAPTNLIETASETKPVDTTVAHSEAKPSVTVEAAVSEPAAPKAVAAVPAPAPASAPVVTASKTSVPVKAVEPPQARAEAAPSQSLDKVISKVSAPTTAPVSASGDMVLIQLASISDEGRAKEELASLQKKFVSDLGGASLRLVRADLGNRGIFYRIQSGPLARDEASRICSALKQAKAGCILVGSK